MKQSSMREKSRRVTRFLITQFIALVGWILVQSFFSLSSAGQHLPFLIIVLIEAIWWIALLAIMQRLFLLEYNRFVRVAIDLEDANQSLRSATNQLLQHMKNNHTEDRTDNHIEDRVDNHREDHGSDYADHHMDDRAQEEHVVQNQRDIEN